MMTFSLKKYGIMIFFIMLLICELTSSEIISRDEIRLFQELLAGQGMDSTSVNFLKDWSGSTRFKLPIVVEILNNPFKFPDFVKKCDQVISSRESEKIYTLFGEYTFDQHRYESKRSELEIFYNTRVSKPKDLFDYVDHVWAESAVYHEKAWEKVTSQEKELLDYLTLMIYQEDQDSLEYADFMEKWNIAEIDTLDIIDDVVPILEKIDFANMVESGYILLQGFDVLQAKLAENIFTWKKIREKETPWGKFAIGTYGNDHYEGSYSLIIDPGGDDFYDSRLSTDRERPFFWLLDLEGNDRYENKDIRGLFSVNFGNGIISDLEGDDFYLGGDFSLSAVLGSLIFTDQEGDDIYQTGLHGIGSASFGLNIHRELEGSDIYSVSEFGEGFAGTMASGILADYSGNDVYYSGGKYLHEPLAPLDYRSLSQGFGFGLRPDLGGGIGILYDGEGNDRYNGGVYAQAVAYWYALGILIDKEGNDFYDAVYYPQGSGIHLAGGFLFDYRGEDHYHSKHGPGQGAAHDYAVGFLVDREGNDIYSIEGGNGLALTNSVGVFLDVSGDDQYCREIASNLGHATQARDSGGIGIFLDTGGDDKYALERCQNNTIWYSGTYGVGCDTLLVENREPVKEMAVEKVAEIDSTADIGRIFAIASEWGVGSAVERVKRAGEILIRRDEESAKYIAEKEMDSKSGLVLRAIMDFAGKSEEFSKYYDYLLNDQDSLVVKNTIAVIGETGDTTRVDILSSFLKKKQYINSVLSSLGNIRHDSALDILSEYRFSNSEKTRVIVARGLKKQDCERSRLLLMEMKDDPSFLIRSMIRIINEM